MNAKQKSEGAGPEDQQPHVQEGEEEKAKSSFTVLMGDDEISDCVEAVLRANLSSRYELRCLRFTRASELARLAREHPFDLIVCYLSNVDWDQESETEVASTIVDTEEADFVARACAGLAVKPLAALHRQYGKPVIATQGANLAKLFDGTGVHFLESPFTVEDFRRLVREALPSVGHSGLESVK